MKSKPAKYYVWDRKNRLPTKKHHSLSDAISEATRLSEKHPEAEFVVVYIVKIIEPKAKRDLTKANS